jgi:hypothetical protein
MKAIVVLTVLLFPLTILSQHVDSILYQRPWIDQETRIINGYAITKNFGEQTRNRAVLNVLPITSVSYKDFDQLKTELENEAAVNDWSDEKLARELTMLQDSAPGGQLQIYISRYSENDANFRWYFIILRGEEDKGKLFEKEIGYQAPQNPYERGWWNFTTMDIPIKLETPFYVYLNHKNTEYLSDFRFHVDKEKEPEPELDVY